jgi:hypothetical protein
MALIWCAHCGAYVDHDPGDVHHRVFDAPLATDRWKQVIAAVTHTVAAQRWWWALAAWVIGAIASLSAGKQAS